MARPRDPKVDEAIVTATVALLGERGFGSMTVEAVADRAGVGKPAIYRRFADKAALVEAVISWQPLEPELPDRGDTRAELWEAVRKGLPTDGAGYLRLVGGLVAEEERHPELIAALRAHLLLPRRAIVIGLIARGRPIPAYDNTNTHDLTRHAIERHETHQNSVQRVRNALQPLGCKAEAKICKQKKPIREISRFSD